MKCRHDGGFDTDNHRPAVYNQLNHITQVLHDVFRHSGLGLPDVLEPLGAAVSRFRSLKLDLSTVQY